MTWPPPELDVGTELGELRLPEDERPEFCDVPVLPEVACWVLLPDPEEPEEPEEAVAAPGRLNATAPAAITLAAAADTVTARSRAPPRSLAATRAAMLYLRSLMPLSLAASSPQALLATSEPAMNTSNGEGCASQGGAARLTQHNDGA